ncbi:MAG: M20 family metallopeptidase [Verrucomicrobiales bacterium]
MTTIAQLLQELIRIPSVNPESDPGVSPGGEMKLARYLADFLAPLGFELTLEEVLPGRPNLIARAPGPSDRPRVLLGPHLDTVGVTGMTIPAFEANFADGKIHGRGASDTKGPMAAMLWGLRANAEKLATLPVAFDFVAFCGEESNQPGSLHFARHHASAYAFAIVGEPTSLQAVHSSKGCLWATLEAHGKAAHASRPELGDNALLKLTRALHRIQETLPATFAGFPDPLLGPPSLNIGMIQAGTRPNIVPDHASARFDIRSTPALVAQRSVRELLNAYLDENQPEITLGEASEFPPMHTPADHPWLRALQAAVPELTLTGAPWFSDAAHLAAAGLPAICLGPGSIDQAHTKDEFIQLSELEAGGLFFTHLISSLAPAGTF